MVATPFETCQQSNTRGSAPWLHAFDWTKSSNRNMQETYTVLWQSRQNFAVVMSRSCSPTPRQKLAWQVALSTFQQHHRGSTKVDVLETGDVPILFSVLQMECLGMTIELDPKGHTIACPAFFGLCSSPASPQWDILCWT